MTHTVVNPDTDMVDNWTHAGAKSDSSDNNYKDWINDMGMSQFLSGSFGTDWAGTGGSTDVATTLPSPPSDGKKVLRYNTDLTELRRYTYDSVQWQPETIGGGGLTTTVENIVATGAGTAIDYGTAPRVKHTMQIIARANTGDIIDIEVNFEGSLNGVEFFPLFSLFAKDITSGNETVINSIEISLVEVRYNVTLFDVVGDADLDVSITGVL